MQIPDGISLRLQHLRVQYPTSRESHMSLAARIRRVIMSTPHAATVHDIARLERTNELPGMPYFSFARYCFDLEEGLRPQEQ